MDEGEKGVSFLGILKDCACYIKNCYFQLSDCTHLRWKNVKSSHHCQLYRNKARASEESFTSGNVALTWREGERRNQLPINIMQNWFAFLASATFQQEEVHADQCQIYVQLLHSHSSVLNMQRHTFADIDRASHQPYVILETDAKPAAWQGRGSLLNT